MGSQIGFRLLTAVLGLVLAGSFAAPLRASEDAKDTSGPYVGIRAIGSLANIDDVSAKGFGGPQLTQNDSDQVAGPAFVAGWVFKNFPLRTEIEAGYRVRFDLDVRDLAPPPMGTVDYEVDVATLQVLINAVLEWRNASAFTPFVGGTFGWARNSTETQRTVLGSQVQSNMDEDQDNIAWGGLVGINWRFAQNWSSDLAYRYINLGEVKTATFPTGEVIETGDYVSHDFLLSVYYNF